MIHSVLTYERDFGYKDKFLQTAYSEEYLPVTILSNKNEVPLYEAPPENIKASAGRIPAYVIKGAKNTRFSGVFTPDLHNPDKGHGDIGNDGVLISNTGNEIMLIVFKDGKKVQLEYFTRWIDEDPEFMEELEDHLKKIRNKGKSN